MELVLPLYLGSGILFGQLSFVARIYRLWRGLAMRCLMEGERLLALADIAACHRQGVVARRKLDLKDYQILPPERGFRSHIRQKRSS